MLVKFFLFLHSKFSLTELSISINLIYLASFLDATSYMIEAYLRASRRAPCSRIILSFWILISYLSIFSYFNCCFNSAIVGSIQLIFLVNVMTLSQSSYLIFSCSLFIILSCYQNYFDAYFLSDQNLLAIIFFVYSNYLVSFSSLSFPIVSTSLLYFSDLSQRIFSNLFYSSKCFIFYFKLLFSQLKLSRSLSFIHFIQFIFLLNQYYSIAFKLSIYLLWAQSLYSNSSFIKFSSFSSYIILISYYFFIFFIQASWSADSDTLAVELRHAVELRDKVAGILQAVQAVGKENQNFLSELTNVLGFSITLLNNQLQDDLVYYQIQRFILTTKNNIQKMEQINFST